MGDARLGEAEDGEADGDSIGSVSLDPEEPEPLAPSTVGFCALWRIERMRSKFRFDFGFLGFGSGVLLASVVDD